jgi:hypothetical protein
MAPHSAPPEQALGSATVTALRPESSPPVPTGPMTRVIAYPRPFHTRLPEVPCEWVGTRRPRPNSLLLVPTRFSGIRCIGFSHPRDRDKVRTAS